MTAFPVEFFLNLYRGCAGLVELRALPSKTQTFIEVGDVGAPKEFADEHALEDVYLGVATRKDASGGQLENCVNLPALFVDLDFKSMPESEARAALERCPLGPSAVVQSGNGLHVYWFLREAVELADDAAHTKTVLRRLARYVGGDLAAAEPARILRLPGTMNHKYDPPRPVVLESLHLDRRVNLADFDFLSAEVETESAGPFRAPEQIHEGARNATLYRTARSLKAKGLASSAILAALVKENAEKCQPPLSDREVADIHHWAMTQADRSGFEPRPTIAAMLGGSLTDPLVVLEDLTADPPLHHVEARLRVLRASLNGADALRRESVRAAAIQRLEELGVRAPARLVDAAFAESGTDDDGQGRAVVLHDIDPWPGPVDGALLLDAMVQMLERFVVLPPGAAKAIALWVLFAHAHDAAAISPMLVLASPVRRCGKTRLLSLVGALVPRPLPTSNITPAALYRSIERFRPTLLVDEADAAFAAANEELRGVLDAGHTRQLAVVVRVVGDNFEPRQFSVWCPKVIALIGGLPASLEDRAVVIPMRRRAPHEPVARLRLDQLAETLAPIARQAARWVKDHAARVRNADPSVPEELHDRAADNWRPLLAIADLAGGAWPERAREAATHLSGTEAVTEESAGVELLADLVQVFDQRGDNHLFTDDVVNALVALEDRPWREWKRGRPLSARGLARLLAPFGVKPRQIRKGETTRKGYRRSELEDNFTRYLPSYPKQPKHTNDDACLSVVCNPKQTDDVSDREPAISPDQCSDVSDVSDVELAPEGEWEEGRL